MRTIDVNAYTLRASAGCDTGASQVNGPLPDSFLIDEYMPEWPIRVRVHFEPVKML
jgi:hypothetical protein